MENTYTVALFWFLVVMFGILIVLIFIGYEPPWSKRVRTFKIEMQNIVDQHSTHSMNLWLSACDIQNVEQYKVFMNDLNRKLFIGRQLKYRYLRMNHEAEMDQLESCISFSIDCGDVIEDNEERIKRALDLANYKMKVAA